MGWNIDFFNTKVLILLLILLFFLIIALIIVGMEYKINKRKVIEHVENTRLMELSKDLKKAKNKESKLAVIDKHAKRLFRERHSVTTNRSYSELEKIFNEKQAYEYSNFCKRMFEAYYSNHTLTDQHVKEILRTLTKLIRETEIYLDAEKYNPEVLYANVKPHEEHMTKEQKELAKSREMKRVEKEKEKIKSEKSKLTNENTVLAQKQQSIVEKEKELSEREKASQKTLKELEEKIKEQEIRIKEQEQLQDKLEKTLELEEKQKLLIQQREAREKAMKKELETRDMKVHWREKIDANPLSGKDWLETRSKRRKKHR
jgi:septal ring factor EnvC (AmiA/AmiB activator)